MKIKICGLSREQDIDYVNEARPDYCGFVFAGSKRKVSAGQAAHLRRHLLDVIIPVGVFVNALPEEIAALYRDGVINIAQLHGDESDEYISQLKTSTGSTPIPVIKAIKIKSQRMARINPNNINLCHSGNSDNSLTLINSSADYYLLDSGAGSGEAFDWGLLNELTIEKPWFLAGGINLDNIGQAMAINPFAIDISSGAETGGIKDREKILQLAARIRKGNTV